LYDLYAVSNHYGSLGGGHYTAFCKQRDGQWFEFDDKRVTPVLDKTVVSSAAYLLFYKKKDFIFQPFNEEWNQLSKSGSDSGEDSGDGTAGGDNALPNISNNTSIVETENGLNFETNFFQQDEMEIANK